MVSRGRRRLQSMAAIRRSTPSHKYGLIMRFKVGRGRFDDNRAKGVSCAESERCPQEEVSFSSVAFAADGGGADLI